MLNPLKNSLVLGFARPHGLPLFCSSLDVDVGCPGVTGIGCGSNSGETECFTTYLDKGSWSDESKSSSSSSVLTMYPTV